MRQDQGAELQLCELTHVIIPAIKYLTMYMYKYRACPYVHMPCLAEAPWTLNRLGGCSVMLHWI